MKTSEFTLVFFIVYDILITWILTYLWLKTRKTSMKKSDYIDELLFELAKARRK